MTSSRSWKSGLLKTGLPLEYVISNSLIKSGHEIFGTYPYIRPDEKKELKEFSVDLRTYKCLDSNSRMMTLSMLVECKYRQPDTSWIFLPFPSDFAPIGLIHSTEDLMPVRLNDDAVWEFEDKTGYCLTGIELDKNGDGKPDGIKHGILQLRFAMPVLLKNEYENALKHDWSEGRAIAMQCAILVTTSKIRLLKPGLTLNDFTQADQLDDICETRDAIIVNERPGPQLQEFADSIADDFIKNHPQLSNRLLELKNVLTGKEWARRSAPDVDTIKRNFGQSTERVLVVNYDAFDKVMTELQLQIKKNLKSEKVYGKTVRTREGYAIKSLENKT